MLSPWRVDSYEKGLTEAEVDSNEAILSKRGGSVAMRVMETQGSDLREDAGKANTRYDIRTEVQDGLLQLASGKRVSAMIDCGACGEKGSARDRQGALLEKRQSTC